jgi:hypothetical protein
MTAAQTEAANWSAAEKDTFWAHIVALLPHMPHASRVAVVQELIQKVGPVPNHLGEKVRALLADPK